MLDPLIFELARAEQWDNLLARLLAAFRVAPAEPIADAIRAISTAALADVPPTTFASDGHRAQMIAQRIRAATPALLGRLIAEAVTLRFGLAVDRLVAIRQHGDDPRLSDAVLELVREPPLVRALLGGRTWNALWQLVEQSGGIRERLEAMAWTPHDDGDLAELHARRDRALAVLAPAPVFSADEAAPYRELAAIAAAPSPRRVRREQQRAALLAAIYADPAARGPKEIYADWLQQHGDPRGELIALQLASDELTPREQALLRVYDGAWRAPLPAAAWEVRYRHGFPCSARDTGDIDDDPAWATIETASGVPLGDGARVPLLAKLRDLSDAQLGRLAQLTRPLAVRSLEWWPPSGSESVGFPPIERIAVLPQLRELSVLRQGTSRAHVERMLAAPMSHALEAFAVNVRAADFIAVLGMVATVPTLERVHLRVGGGIVPATNWMLSRDADGRLTVVSGWLDWHDRHAAEIAEFLEQLARLPPGSVTRVELDVSPPLDLNEERLRRALRRQPLAALRLRPR